MKHILSLLLALCCTLAVGAQTAPHIDGTFRSGGLTRTYKLYLPDQLPPQAPLVVVLHGYGGKGEPADYGMDRVADENGFAVCYPQGIEDSRGKTCWNAGYPFQADMTVDDVKTFADLVRHLQKKYALSRRNVFCTGMSNGGEMCYIIAAQRPDLVAAVAPISGLMMEWLYRSDRGQTAVPLLEIHGTKDVVSAWEGDLVDAGGWGAYMPIPLAIGYWVARDRCTTAQHEPLPGSDGRVIVHRYTGGTDGSEVWLYECLGGSHCWNQDGVDTDREIWRFFSKFVR